MAAPATFNQLSAVTGFKVAHLNIRSVVKKIDQLRLLLHDSKIDLFTLSETWLKPHLQSNIISLPGFTSLRLDRTVKGKGRKTNKRGGGLLMYVRNCHSSLSEHLLELNVSNKDIEAQWVLVHRPHCKNDLFLLGDLNVDFVNKSSVAYKSVNFCAQSNGLTQHIRTTTRNTDKSQTLIDIAFSNSKCVSGSGTLEHFISGHQPIFLIHKKSRDKRELVEFRGRSYRKFDRDQLKADLIMVDWEEFYKRGSPDKAWDFFLEQATLILDKMCPMRVFKIKSYRPDWMTDELIEHIKDRDYFYRKAKLGGNKDDWNIAKHLRNETNSHIRQAKRDFILEGLEASEGNAKKFLKVIRKVIPDSKSSSKNDIMLKDNGIKLPRDQVADNINEFSINVGKVKDSGESLSSKTTTQVSDVRELDKDGLELKGFDT